MTPPNLPLVLRQRVVLPTGTEASIGDLLVSYTNLRQLTEGAPGGELDRSCGALLRFAVGQPLLPDEAELLQECGLVGPDGRPDDPLLVELARSCLVQGVGGRYSTTTPLRGHPAERDFDVLLAAMGEAVGFLTRHAAGVHEARVPQELVEHSSARFLERVRKAAGETPGTFWPGGGR